jgi:hypothetical protein
MLAQILFLFVFIISSVFGRISERYDFQPVSIIQSASSLRISTIQEVIAAKKQQNKP